jgi:hypothetical protein
VNCFVECGIAKRNKRHYIDHSEARVHTDVFMNIEEVDGTCGEESGGECATQGKHAAVMVGVGVNIEEIGGNGCAQFGKFPGVLALADIDDALNHRVIFISSPSRAVVG